MANGFDEMDEFDGGGGDEFAGLSNAELYRRAYGGGTDAGGAADEDGGAAGGGDDEFAGLSNAELYRQAFAGPARREEAGASLSEPERGERGRSVYGRVNPNALPTHDELAAKGERGGVETAMLNRQEETGIESDYDGSWWGGIKNGFQAFAHALFGRPVTNAMNANLQALARGTYTDIFGNETPLEQLPDATLDYVMDNTGANGFAGARALLGERASHAWRGEDNIMRQWDEREGAKFADEAERKRARVAYAKELAQNMLAMQEESKFAASDELAAREETFKGALGRGLLEQGGYTARFMTGPYGLVAGVLEGAERAGELLSDKTKVDKNGEIVADAKRDTMGAALAKGAARGVIAPAVELVGGKLLMAGAKGAVRNTLGRIPLVKAAGGKLATTAAGKSVAAFARKMDYVGRMTGMGSFPEELAEEWEDQILDAAIGLDRRASENAGTTALGRAREGNAQFFTAQNLGDLAKSMILMQVIQGGAAHALDRMNARRVDAVLENVCGVERGKLRNWTANQKQQAFTAWVEGLSEEDVRNMVDGGSRALNRFMSEMFGGHGMAPVALKDGEGRTVGRALVRTGRGGATAGEVNEALGEIRRAAGENDFTERDADGNPVERRFTPQTTEDGKGGRKPMWTPAQDEAGNPVLRLVDAENGVTIDSYDFPGDNAPTYRVYDARGRQRAADGIENALAYANGMVADLAQRNAKLRYIRRMARDVLRNQRVFVGDTMADVRRDYDAQFGAGAFDRAMKSGDGQYIEGEGDGEISGASFWMPETDADGRSTLVPATDRDGNPVYETDAKGKPVLDAAGNPVRKMVRPRAVFFALDSNRSVAELNATAYHEVARHSGLSQMYTPEEKADFLRRLSAGSFGDAKNRMDWDGLVRGQMAFRGKKSEAELWKDPDAVEEIFAVMTEGMTESPSLKQRFMANVYDWYRNRFKQNLDIQPDELAVVVDELNRFARRGGGAAHGGGVTYQAREGRELEGDLANVKAVRAMRRDAANARPALPYTPDAAEGVREKTFGEQKADEDAADAALAERMEADRAGEENPFARAKERAKEIDRKNGSEKEENIVYPKTKKEIQSVLTRHNSGRYPGSPSTTKSIAQSDGGVKGGEDARQTRKNGPVSAPTEAGTTTQPRYAARADGRKSGDEAVAAFDRNSTVLSGDEVRKTMPGYDPKDWSTHVDRTGYVGPRLEAQFRHLLKTRKGKGDGTVVFLAGGNGAGKSTVAAKIGNSHDFTIDSTLGNLEVAKKQIDAILANGQTPEIHFVYRTIGQALEGIAQRVKNGGHIVSPLSFANSHVKSRENLRLLSEAYGDKIHLHIYDNSVDGAPEITLKQLEAKEKPDHARIRESANYYLGHLREREEARIRSQGGVAGGGAKGEEAARHLGQTGGQTRRNGKDNEGGTDGSGAKSEGAGRAEGGAGTGRADRVDKATEGQRRGEDGDAAYRDWLARTLRKDTPENRAKYGTGLVAAVADYAKALGRQRNTKNTRTRLESVLRGMADGKAWRWSVPARGGGRVRVNLEDALARLDKAGKLYGGDGRSVLAPFRSLVETVYPSVSQGRKDRVADVVRNVLGPLWPAHRQAYKEENRARYAPLAEARSRAAKRTLHGAKEYAEEQGDLRAYADAHPESRIARWLGTTMFVPSDGDNAAIRDWWKQNVGFGNDMDRATTRFLAGRNMESGSNDGSDWWREVGEDLSDGNDGADWDRITHFLDALLDERARALEWAGKTRGGERAAWAEDERAPSWYGKAEEDMTEDERNAMEAFARDELDEIEGANYDVTDDPHTLFRRSPSGAEAVERARREYDGVVARYTNPDGTRKPGWMKAPNGKPTNLTERQWVQVRTPAFKRWFGDWETIAETADMRIVKSVSEAAKAVRDAGLLNQDIVNHRLGLTARISGANLSKMESEKATEKSASPRLHALAVANVDRLFASASVEMEHPDTHGRKEVERVRRLGTVMRDPDGGSFVPVMLTVVEYRQYGKKVYTVEAVDVGKYKNPAGQLADSPTNGDTQAPIAEFVGKVAKLAAEVNPSAVSKVVDANGEPLVVYHGSKMTFSVFDTDGRPGTKTEDTGAFFTDRRRVAAGYGSSSRDVSEGDFADLDEIGEFEGGGVYPTFLNIRNPLSVECNGNNWDDIYGERWRVYNEEGDVVFASGSESECEEYCKEHEDESLMWDEDSFGMTSTDDFIKHDVRNSEHDGAVFENVVDNHDYCELTSNVYVVLDPAQVKSATDNAGAFDPANPDIRFSIAADSLSEVERKSLRDAQTEAQRVLDRIGGTELGNSINRDFRGEARTTLVGKTVRTARDLAALAQVYRNPCFETFRYVFTNKGEVVWQTGVTSRLPGSSPATVHTPRENTYAEIERMIAKLKPDGAWLLHNHPSGNVLPSQADVNVTNELREYFDRLGVALSGHVVIDHDKYAEMDKYGNYYVRRMSADNLEASYHGNPFENPARDIAAFHGQLKEPGEKFGPYNIAVFYARLQRMAAERGKVLTLIAVDSKASVVTSVANVPAEVFDGDGEMVADTLADYRGATGGRFLFVVGDQAIDDYGKAVQDAVRRQMENGNITDVLWHDASWKWDSVRQYDPFVVDGKAVNRLEKRRSATVDDGQMRFSVGNGEDAGVRIAPAYADALTFSPVSEQAAKTSVRAWRSGRKVFTNARNECRAEIKSDWSKIFSTPAKKKSASYEAHYAAANHIDTLFERGVKMWEEPPRNGSNDIRAYAKYGCPFAFGGETYLAKITVKEYADRAATDGVYSVEAISVEKIGAEGINAGITSLEGHELDLGATGALSKMLTTTPRIVPHPGHSAQGGEMRFSIGRLYTGSAADYERPSLHFVGTGEGSQVYGWGLYASNVRGVAEEYARATKKKAEKAARLFYLVDGVRISDAEVAKSEGYETADGLGMVAKGHGRAEVADYFDDLAKSQSNPDRAASLRKAARYLRDHEIVFEKQSAPAENVYEQTFFTDRAPGDESHLLKWYEPVSEEQLTGIGDGASRLAVRKLPSGALNVGFERDGRFTPIGVEFANGLTGGKLYGMVAKSLGSPKAASEFLARAGIDGVKYPADSYGGKGVKDGDEAGWNYVSFRDDNIRVDHKWRDGGMVFRRVTDKSEIARLENDPKGYTEAYASAQVIDGKVYSPMAAYIDGKLTEPFGIGEWQKSEEHPELADANGNFKLDKTGRSKDAITAKYNPYWHSVSLDSPLNDQFSTAYARPNLVMIKVRIPNSDLLSGYRAENAKDPVGALKWKSGDVTNALKRAGKPDRTVFLSRYRQVLKVLSNDEAARLIARQLEGVDIRLPANVVTPAVRDLLVGKYGVRLGEPTGNANARAKYARELREQGVRFRRDPYGRGSSLANGTGFTDLEPGDTFENLEKAIAARIGEEVQNVALGITARIGSKANASHLMHKMSSFGDEDAKAHKYAAKNVLALFAKARLAISQHDKKGTPNDYIRAFVPFTFADRTMLATVTLRHDRAGDRLYAVESVETETGSSPRSSRRTAQGAQLPVSLEGRIAYYVGNVNSTQPKFIGENSGEVFSTDALAEKVNAEIDKVAALNLGSEVGQGGVAMRRTPGTGKDGRYVAGTNRTVGEAKRLLAEDLSAKLADASEELETEIHLVGLDIHGSRVRGGARADSDLDVVFEYEGDVSEDALFDLVNENQTDFDGIKVDFNPIRADKTGTLEDYMRRSDEYDAEVLGKTPKRADGGEGIRFSMSAIRAMESLADGNAAGIVHNERYGDIEYPLGRFGRRGFGLAHIVENRMGKDDKTLDEAVDTAIRVAEAATDGTVTAERYNTRHFDKDGVRAIVAFMQDGSRVITGYEISADDSDGANRRPPESRPLPHVSLEEIVAALKSRLAKLAAKRSVPHSSADAQGGVALRNRRYTPDPAARLLADALGLSAREAAALAAGAANAPLGVGNDRRDSMPGAARDLVDAVSDEEGVAAAFDTTRNLVGRLFGKGAAERWRALRRGLRRRLTNYLEPVVEMQRLVERRTLHRVRVEDSVADAAKFAYSHQTRMWEDAEREVLAPLYKEIAGNGLGAPAKSIGEGTVLHELLLALHGPAFNRMISERTDGKTPDGSGASTAFWLGVLRGHGANGTDAQLLGALARGDYAALGWAGGSVGAKAEKAVSLVRELTDRTRDVLERSGRLSAKQRATWEALSPFYVPMRFDQDADDNFVKVWLHGGTLEGGGYARNYAGGESRHAFGHRNIADNPVVFALQQHADAIQRATDNDVRRKLADMVRRNEFLGHVVDADGIVDMGGVVNPRAPSGFVGLPRAKTLGADTKARESTAVGSLEQEDNIVAFKEGGDVKFIVLGPRTNASGRGAAEDRALSEAEARLVGRAVKKTSLAQVGPVLKFVRGLTRTFGQLRTTLSPEFLVSNFLADNAQAAGNVYATFGAKGVAQFERGVPAALASARRMLNGKLGTSRMDTYAREMREGGGLIGGLSTANFADVRRDVEREVAKFAGDRKVRVLDFISHMAERMNAPFEVASRLSAYAVCRENGMTQAEAAKYAREVTVDFNQKGEWTPVLNALYAFSNASLVDMERSFGAYAARRGLRLSFALVALGFLSSMLGYWQDDPDDAREGEAQWKDTKDYVKQNKLGFRAGTNLYSVPIRGVNRVLYYAGHKLWEVLSGRQGAGEAAWEVGSFAASNLVDPIGDAAKPLQAVTPSVLRPGMELLQNESFSGAQIYREPMNRRLDVRSAMGRRTTPGIWHNVAEAMNAVTGGNRNKRGAIDVQPEVYQYVYSWLTGSAGNDIARAANVVKDIATWDFSDMEDARNVPFVRRFTSGLQANTPTFREKMDEFNEDVKQFKDVANEDPSVMADLRARHPFFGASPSARRWLDELTDLGKAARKLMKAEMSLDGEDRKAAHRLRLQVQAAFIHRFGHAPEEDTSDDRAFARSRDREAAKVIKANRK